MDCICTNKAKKIVVQIEPWNLDSLDNLWRKCSRWIRQHEVMNNIVDKTKAEYK